MDARECCPQWQEEFKNLAQGKLVL